MDHSVIRATIIPKIVSLIMERYGMDEAEALDAFYRSATGDAYCDDKTGLYGQSPLYIFSLYAAEKEGLDVKD